VEEEEEAVGGSTVREGSRRGRGPGWLTRFALPRGRIPSGRFHHFHESLPPSSTVPELKYHYGLV
jgi:hypothetical protein